VCQHASSDLEKLLSGAGARTVFLDLVSDPKSFVGHGSLERAYKPLSALQVMYGVPAAGGNSTSAILTLSNPKFSQQPAGGVVNNNNNNNNGGTITNNNNNGPVLLLPLSLEKLSDSSVM
jgi:hypothetical protein